MCLKIKQIDKQDNTCHVTKLKKEIEKIGKEIFLYGLVNVLLNIAIGYLFIKNLMVGKYIQSLGNFIFLSINQHTYSNFVKNSGRLELATENLIKVIEMEAVRCKK